MSTYLQTGKGWRYDFTQNGKRFTQAGFKTKREARKAEANRKEEVKVVQATLQTETVTEFSDLVNLRLDHIKAYKSAEYYRTHLYLARMWITEWEDLRCDKISTGMVQHYLIKRRNVSAYVGNKELRHLRALFNFGKKHRYIANNPADGLEFFPLEKKEKYVPSVEDVEAVISLATPDIHDYLWTVADTLARIGEINQLRWDDVNFTKRYVVLYTSKKRDRCRTPRRIPMTQRLYNILFRRFANRDETQPWVFCNRYLDWKTGQKVSGPYQYRSTILKTLCKKAGVKVFGFHALRHLGASMMDSCNVPIGSIQKILGHENRTTTEIYLHSIGNAEHEAIAIYEMATQKAKSLTPSLTLAQKTGTQ